MMSDRAALVKAVRDNPADLTARLVYADWLDEYGTTDCDRATAEYLRLCSDPVKGPKGTKALPSRVYKWLCSGSRSLWHHDRHIGFPLPGAPALIGHPRYDPFSWREVPGEVIEAPEVCNWHRLIPSVLALDSWGRLPESERDYNVRMRNYRPTPRFWRDGNSILVRLTLPGTDPHSLFVRSRPQLRLRFSTQFLVEANGLFRRAQWLAVERALYADLPFVNPTVREGEL